MICAVKSIENEALFMRFSRKRTMQHTQTTESPKLREMNKTGTGAPRPPPNRQKRERTEECTSYLAAGTEPSSPS